MDYADCEHNLIEIKFECLVCGHTKTAYSHPSKQLSGDSLECPECHNYILYLEEDGSIWKDEIYFEKPYYLFIRDFKLNETYLYLDESDCNAITLNQIIEFDSADKLLKKAKTIVVFS